MCSACCCLRACINAVALVLVSSGQELGTELIKDFTDKFKAAPGLASGNISALLVLGEPESSEN